MLKLFQYDCWPQHHVRLTPNSTTPKAFMGSRVPALTLLVKDWLHKKT